MFTDTSRPLGGGGAGGNAQTSKLQPDPNMMQLPSERWPAGWLPKTLRTRDLTILCLFAVLLITNVQLVAGGGAAGFLYWMLGFFLFLIPSALVCAQLYRFFPGEGAVYLWARKAFGGFWDTFLGFFCNWWPGAIGLTVEVGAFVSSIQALHPDWLAVSWQQGLAEILVLLLAQALCFLDQQRLQRILNIAFFAYVSMVALVGLAGVFWVISGHQLQGDFSPQGWQLSSANAPIFATVVVALLGIAIPLNLGAEVTHERNGYTYLFWGVLITIVGYLFATFAILAVLPAKDLANPAFLGLVFRRAFGPGLGDAISVINYLILAFYFVCATAAYNSMFARLLLVAGVDHRLPRPMRKLSPRRVPINATIVQTCINIVFVAVLFFLTPSANGLSTTVFLVIMNAASVVWNIAMIALFLCGIILGIRFGSQFKQRWLVPFPVLLLASLCGILASCVAIYSTFFVGSPVPNVLGNEDWVFWVLLTVLVSLVIGAIYSFLAPEAEDLIALLHSNKSASIARKEAPNGQGFQTHQR
ncbi:APC family permease [Ktedonosporobacter rubrisoli]|uniref:APC family permease n=1 Tax=Ktedonosporobacter rubrisoli TaxID=2509675 RepID=A0A4P6JMS4_KTERU|nr:APC family permease [Ktedonosporobacter rubrisoli]QBD76569.1 APC family permease [Ktedonosporobacter rubrisoli]